MIRQDIVACQKCGMLKELSEQCECSDEKVRSTQTLTHSLDSIPDHLDKIYPSILSINPPIWKSRRSEWLEWTHIGNHPNYEGHGVYKLRLVNSEGIPIEIPRFLDNDQDGILQIGCSKNIQKGMKFFNGAIEGKKYAHAEGKRLYLLKKYTHFIERYNQYHIQYSFRKVATQREAREEQELLLKYYVQKYGEVPPINSHLSDKYIDWEGVSIVQRQIV